MQHVVVDFKPHVFADYRQRVARTSAVNAVYASSAGLSVTKPTGELLLHVEPIKAKTGLHKLYNAVRRMQYAKNQRVNGMISRSRTIGYSPRVQARQDFCSAAESSYKYKAEHDLLWEWALWACERFDAVNPAVSQWQRAELDTKVAANWRVEGTVCTSGIINKANPLPYHRDMGNFKGFWSLMLSLTLDLKGGELVLPELDLAIRYDVPSLTLFDGASIIHGVAPIQSGERYSIVYYALQQMWRCQTVEDELKRIRTLKTTHQRKRAKRADAPARTL